MLNSGFPFSKNKQHMRGARRPHNSIHFMMSEFRTVIDVFGPKFNALSQDIIMSKTFSYRLFRVFFRSVNKVMRKNRKSKPMNVIVESSQGDSYIHASLQDDLSGSIEGKFVMQNQVIKLVDQGKIISDFERRAMRRRAQACFIVSSVSRISNVLFQLRIKMNYPTSMQFAINGRAMKAK